MFYTNETDLHIFYVISKQEGGEHPLFMDANLSRYIKMEFYQSDIDYSKETFDGIVIPARQCQEKDFIHPRAKAHFEKWQLGTYSLVCPDYTDDD